MAALHPVSGDTSLSPRPDAQATGLRGLVLNTTARSESALGFAVEFVTGALVVAEICILLWGVIARFVLHQPLTWSDELAAMLFVWLAMLGSVVAIRRGEHMRMASLVNMMSPSRRAFMEAAAMAACLLFAVLALEPAYEYAAEEAVIAMPALQISLAWRASALPVGLGLLAIFIVFRLVRQSLWRHSAVAVGIAALIGVGVWSAGDVFAELGNLNLVIFFVGLTGACVLAGFPIFSAFGLATAFYLLLSTNVPLPVIVGRMDEGMSHLVLLAVPLFVFLGLLLDITGMARAMIAFLGSLLGHVRGGLNYVLIGAMYLVSGISGSKTADMAAIAPALVPEMKKRGVDEGELVALLSATGAQTETIPPSLVLITIGSVTGISIAALFAGGLLPAAVVGMLLCGVVWYRNRHLVLDGQRRAPGREVGKLFLAALPAIALPFVIRGAVVEGVATATEVSTIGIVYSLIVGMVFYERPNWRRLGPALVSTASLSGAILLIIGTATAMAWGLTQSGFSQQLVQSMVDLGGGIPVFLALSIIAFIVLGSVLEGIPAIVLFAPLLFPVSRALGIHDVHYAMVVILSMGVGLFAPPMGVGYYAACAICRIDPGKGLKPIIPYLAAVLVGVVLIAAVPWFSLGMLPNR